MVHDLAGRRRGPIWLVGAGGFLAGAVRRGLHARGRSVLLSGRQRPEELYPQEHWVRWDVQRAVPAATLRRHVPEAVVYLAAQFDLRPSAPWGSLVAVNVLGALAAGEAAQRLGARRFVCASSVTVYGTVIDGSVVSEDAPLAPAGPYGASKAMAEVALGAAACAGTVPPVLALRFAGLYGIGAPPVFSLASFIARAARHEALEVRRPESRRQYCYVEDAATAVERALDAAPAAPFRAYNVAGPESLTIARMAHLVAAAYGARVRHAGSGGDAGCRYRLTRARRELGFRPRYTLRTALREMRTGTHAS